MWFGGIRFGKWRFESSIGALLGFLYREGRPHNIFHPAFTLNSGINFISVIREQGEVAFYANYGNDIKVIGHKKKLHGQSQALLEHTEDSLIPQAKSKMINLKYQHRSIPHFELLARRLYKLPNTLPLCPE